jgi:tetratricopeptide (TPR) repeat protein
LRGDRGAGRIPFTTEPSSATDRLDSWKDIAAYVHRDVSTVQRWEKREGMPVHRHVHEKLGSVYAFRSELDAWSRGRGVAVTQQETRELASVPEHEEPATLERGTPPRLRSHWRLALAGVLALALVGAVAFVIPFARNPTGDADAISPQPPVRGSAEAQDLLRQARYLSVRTTDADNQRAIELLERAIKLDDTIARAHAELASAYVTRLAYVTPGETNDLEQKAFSAAEKAISLDKNVPEAYLARGDLLWTNSHHFAHERAVQEFRRALDLNPQSDAAHRRLARVFVHVGFFDEAIRHADIALKNNPSNWQAVNSRAQALLWMGKDEEALTILRSIPGPVLPELVDANITFALMRLGRRDEALSFFRQASVKYPNDQNGNLPAIEAMLLADSEPEKAHALTESVRKRKTGNPSHHAAYFAACAAARMGRAQEAVHWLREAAATGFPCLALFEHDRNLDPIRHVPQFRAFMIELRSSSAALRRALFPGEK